jgi:hypothetical protein
MYVLFSSLLLVHINCTKGFHCDIFIHVHNVLLSNSPLYYFLFPTFLTIILMGSIVFSHMHIKYFDHIHSPAPSLFAFLSTGCLSKPSTFTFGSVFKGLDSAYERKYVIFVFLKLGHILLNVVTSSSIYFPVNDIISFFCMFE